MLASLPDRPSRFLGTLFWTWVNWLVKLAALGWVLAALAPVGFAAGVLGAIGGDLTTVLPIHAPGGFGTYEAGVALLLAPLVDEPRPCRCSFAVRRRPDAQVGSSSAASSRIS